jgi:Cu(I)/Ag(I) efflux system membrane protein CusA/SilA
MVYFMGLIYLCCSRVYRTFGMAIETAMIMTIYLNEAMNKMVKNMAIAVRQLPRTSSDSTLLMALQKTEAKINDGFGFSGLVPILWSTGTGADVMIPITVPLIGGTITSVIYVLLVTPIVFEMTKQHELRTKGKIDLIDATH